GLFFLHDNWPSVPAQPADSRRRSAVHPEKFYPGRAGRNRTKDRPGQRESGEVFSIAINPECRVRTGSGSDRIMKFLDMIYMIYKIGGMHSSSVSLSW